MESISSLTVWVLIDEECWKMDSAFQYHHDGTKIRNNFGTNLTKISETGASEKGGGGAGTHPNLQLCSRSLNSTVIKIQTPVLYFLYTHMYILVLLYWVRRNAGKTKSETCVVQY